MIWCNMATVDSHGRPRSRVVHPVWENGACWIGTRPGSFKGQHLARNPYVSLAYVADALQLSERVTVADEATAEYISEFTDPEVNGPFTRERAQAIVRELAQHT